MRNFTHTYNSHMQYSVYAYEEHFMLTHPWQRFFLIGGETLKSKGYNCVCVRVFKILHNLTHSVKKNSSLSTMPGLMQELL